MFTYYCIMRPPTPGAIPRGAVNVSEFPTRLYVPVIDRMAWGYVQYDRELCPSEVYEYELVMEPREE